MNVHLASKSDIAEQYLDLLIRTLCRFDGADEFKPHNLGSYSRGPKKLLARAFVRYLQTLGCEIVQRTPFDADMRRTGRDLPMHADTLIGIKRLENARDAVQTVISEDVSGDIVETGVWRGGASILMRATLEACGDMERLLWCADSFEGLPPPDMDRYPQDVGMVWHTDKRLAISLEEVRRNFRKYGYLDNRVKFLKGWFKDTLPNAPIGKIAVLRLDGDLYASTMDALNPLYDKVSPGGFIIVDDYGLPQDTCRRAVHDFRDARGIKDPIIDIDGWGAYWRKA
jgi:O-methyltransferase